MKKLILPFFLVLATAAGFTSCGDDDEEEKHAKITMTIDGSEVKSGEAVTLAKTTVDVKNTGADVITLNIESDCDINALQVYVNNKWEKDVDVVTTDTIAYNSINKEKTPSLTKQISFTGVMGEYTVKVKTKVSNETLKFKVKNDEDETEYIGNSRYLSNKQLIIFDASGDTHKKSILGATFVVDKSSNTKYLAGNMCEINEADFVKYSTDYSKSEFSGVANKSNYSTKYNINTVPGYFIYKNKENNYLMKIVSIDGNIMIAEIQY